MEAEKMLRTKDSHEQGIVVLLTDGEPTTAGGECNDRFGRMASKHMGAFRKDDGDDITEQLTTEAEWLNREHRFIPIGIQCDTIKRWWPNAHVVHDLSKFTDVVLDEFGKAVQRA
jgi:hypothetical protein